jgi:hypothetical protein
LIVYLTLLEIQITDRFYAQQPSELTKLLAGPVGLITHLLRTTNQILVNFLSVTVGRWVMSLTPPELPFWDTVTAVLLGVSLLWFVGISAGLMQLPKPDPRKTK